MTSEQQYLIQQARESLNAARLLLREGYPGFAASRAYYTMFYIAKACLLNKGLTYSKHSTVVSAFGQHFAKTGQVRANRTRMILLVNLMTTCYVISSEARNPSKDLIKGKDGWHTRYIDCRPPFLPANIWVKDRSQGFLPLVEMT